MLLTVSKAEPRPNDAGSDPGWTKTSNETEESWEYKVLIGGKPGGRRDETTRIVRVKPGCVFIAVRAAPPGQTRPKESSGSDPIFTILL